MEMEENGNGGVELFNLRWNSYVRVLKESIAKLQSSGKFADVTLACEGRSLKCHRSILSAFSPHLAQVLQEVPSPDGVIYLGNGIKFTTLQTLVSFMYSGQVEVTQSEIPDLLKAAQELNVKGLSASTARSKVGFDGEQEVGISDDGNTMNSNEDGIITNLNSSNSNSRTPSPVGSRVEVDEGILSGALSVVNGEDVNEQQIDLESNAEVENEEIIWTDNLENVPESTAKRSGASKASVDGSGNLSQKVKGEGKGTRPSLKRNKKSTYKAKSQPTKAKKTLASKSLQQSKKTPNQEKKKGKNQRKLITKSTPYGEMMKEALDRVAAGERVSKLATHFGIPISTLCKYVKNPERMQTSKIYSWVAP